MNQADSKNNDYQYDAFISYNGEDKAFAEALEKALENYDPPKDLAVPQRHLNIFRYEGDMTGTEYSQAIQGHLDKSAKLIILCSPNARKSQFVNKEIQHFGKFHTTKDIIPILVNGVPNNAAKRGQKDKKAFPQALCKLMKMPLATSYLEFEPGKNRIDKGLFKGAWYTVLANIYGLSRDELEQRDKRKKIRMRRMVTGIVSTVMLALLSLTAVALWQREIALDAQKRADENAWEAEEQRNIAQSNEKAAQDSAKVAQQQRDLAVSEKNRADENAREAEKQKGQAQKRLLEANYNLAKFYHARTQEALKNARKTNSTAERKLPLLYAMAALDQEIDQERQALDNSLLIALFNRFDGWPAFRERWFSSENEGRQEFSLSHVAFSPDGLTLASGSWDDSIRLWDVATGKEKAKLDGHTTPVLSVAFSADGLTLASGSADKTVRLWDMATGKEKAKLEGHTSFVWSIAFSGDGLTLASGSADKTVRLWDVATGIEKAKLDGHTDDVYSVAYSPDGLTLASGSVDNSIRLWDVATGKEKAKLDGPTDEDDVSSVAFSPDGSTLASGYRENSIRLWDVATGKEKAKLDGHTSDVRSVAFSPDGKTLASSSEVDNTIRLWDVATGKEKAKLDGYTDDVSSVAFSPDGKTLASGSGGHWRADRSIRLWDVATSKEKAKLTGHTGVVYSVAFSADGLTLASGSGDDSIRLWDVATGKEKAKLEGHTSYVRSVAFSPDGLTLASGSADKTVRLWDVATGKEKAKLEGHTGRVYSVAFSGDGLTLASGSGDESIRLWDVAPYDLFLEEGRATTLFKKFMQGAMFFWQIEKDGLGFKQIRFESTYEPINGYYFEHDPACSPLLAPPAVGQSKFDQILQWAQAQLDEETGVPEYTSK